MYLKDENLLLNNDKDLIDILCKISKHKGIIGSNKFSNFYHKEDVEFILNYTKEKLRLFREDKKLTR